MSRGSTRRLASFSILLALAAACARVTRLRPGHGDVVGGPVGVAGAGLVADGPVLGQPGADADLDTLLTAGAITANGQPAASLTAAATAAGAAAPISGGGNSGGATGGTGGTGGTGTTTK